MTGNYTCNSPDETFAVGECLGNALQSRDAVLLHGGLGAGKTLLTKGILHALGFDVDEVTSPSFTLVNHYPTERFDVYHLDVWRIVEGSDAAFGVGLNEIVENENSIVIIEWAERLGKFKFPGRVFDISIEGEGDDARSVEITNTDV